uniref:Uncharacterized protein n=1 Tax=Sus scrofa TaxID=9823 RepID=A0A8D0S7Z4_PIG
VSETTEFGEVCHVSHLILKTVLIGFLQLPRPGITTDAGDWRDKFSAGTAFG